MHSASTDNTANTLLRELDVLDGCRPSGTFGPLALFMVGSRYGPTASFLHMICCTDRVPTKESIVSCSVNISSYIYLSHIRLYSKRLRCMRHSRRELKVQLPYGRGHRNPCEGIVLHKPHTSGRKGGGRVVTWTPRNWSAWCRNSRSQQRVPVRSAWQHVIVHKLRGVERLDLGHRCVRNAAVRV